MRAPISVIIPTLNAGAVLPRCLAGLVEGLERGLIREVILSDGGSCDDTLAVAAAWGAEVVTGEASRGAQLLRGCDAANGEWLLIVHADTVLDPGWARAAVLHMRTDQAGWFKLAFDAQGFAAKNVAAWANLRSSWGLPYGDQGLLISRPLYDQVGGYRDIPLMEDVAMVRALKGRLRRIDATATTSADKYRSQGWLRRGLRNLMLLAQFFAGRDPHHLARAYRRK